MESHELIYTKIAFPPRFRRLYIYGVERCWPSLFWAKMIKVLREFTLQEATESGPTIQRNLKLRNVKYWLLLSLGGAYRYLWCVVSLFEVSLIIQFCFKLSLTSPFRTVIGPVNNQPSNSENYWFKLQMNILAQLNLKQIRAFI